MEMYNYKHPLHPIYRAMIYRCNNSNHKWYDYYGGRGIKVCERWQGAMGFKNFVLDMGDKPSSQHSIDRIDNNKGYSPDNCRWATSQVQNINKRIQKSNRSGTVGVCFHKQKQRWEAYIRANGKIVHLGKYREIEDAIQARKAAEIKYHKPLLEVRA